MNALNWVWLNWLKTIPHQVGVGGHRYWNHVSPPGLHKLMEMEEHQRQQPCLYPAQFKLGIWQTLEKHSNIIAKIFLIPNLIYSLNNLFNLTNYIQTLTAENDDWKYIGILTQHAQWKQHKKSYTFEHIFNYGNPIWENQHWVYFSISISKKYSEITILETWLTDKKPAVQIYRPSFISYCLSIFEYLIMKW
jgi:hypothetical protein